MYWTHLIFALFYGLLISWNEITASKPGYLDFDNLPETNFSCDGKVIGGYYADVETGCQMFHVCTIGQKGEVTDIKFLCLNGTVFDQETRVCERIDEVDCAKSEDFFGLNLELYGNNANFGGIQPENEFETECDECSTDEDYEETTAQPTTTPTPSTTSTTTTTTPRPTTSQRPHYQNGDTIQALLALHSAFNQGLQGKAPPPRVINNAFSPTPKPPTRRPQPDLNYKSRYTPDSQSYGSLNLQQRERPYYFTPATEKSNYHHFHSGDTSFGHSFDATRPYNFQYFHSRKLPDDGKDSVSVVTSTSTSTSVKTSKGNATEYPTGYEDYQDDIQDHAFFKDVPKLRQKREDKHPNHKYEPTEEVTTPRHRNHKYDDEPSSETSEEREEFLQNLLGSIDLDEQIREKMSDFFKKEDKEIDEMEKEGNSLVNLGNKIGQVFTEVMNMSRTDDKKSKAEKLSEWAKHFDDMKKDINLNYTFEANFTSNVKREKRDTLKTENTRSTIAPLYTQERTQPRRTNIDTEHFRVEPRRKKTAKSQSEFKPVSESIEDDFTTVEYRRASKTGRSQPKSTTSLRAFTFNYEVTSALPEYIDKHTRISKSNAPASKEIIDFVHEDIEYPVYNRENIQGRGNKQNVAVDSPGTSEEFASREAVTPSNVRRNRPRVLVTKRGRPVDQASRESTEHLEEEQPRGVRIRQRARVPSAVRQEEPVLRHRPVQQVKAIRQGPSQHHEVRQRPVQKTEVVRHSPVQTMEAIRHDPAQYHEEGNPMPGQKKEEIYHSPEPQQEEVGQTYTQLQEKEHQRIVQEQEDIRHGLSKQQEDVRHKLAQRQENERHQHIQLKEELRQRTVKQQEEVRQRPLQQQQELHHIPVQQKVELRQRPLHQQTPRQKIEQPSEDDYSEHQQTSRQKIEQPSEDDYSGRQRHQGGSRKRVQESVRRTPGTRGQAHHTTELPSTLAPRPTLTPDPDFDCEGKVKGGFYADVYNNCKAFFICSQGMINGPLLKTHFACGDKTKFNQRSRTCQAEDLVECDLSSRYYHLNNDFLVPVSEDELRGGFEPMRER